MNALPFWSNTLSGPGESVMRLVRVVSSAEGPRASMLMRSPEWNGWFPSGEDRPAGPGSKCPPASPHGSQMPASWMCTARLPLGMPSTCMKTSTCLTPSSEARSLSVAKPWTGSSPQLRMVATALAEKTPDPSTAEAIDGTSAEPSARGTITSARGPRVHVDISSRKLITMLRTPCGFRAGASAPCDALPTSWARPAIIEWWRFGGQGTRHPVAR